MRNHTRSRRKSPKTAGGSRHPILPIISIAAVIVAVYFIYSPLLFRSTLRNLSKGSDASRRSAVWKTVEYGKKAVPPLVKLMKSKSDKTGRYAAMALAEIGAVEEALNLLESNDPQTRVNAVRALAQMDDEKSRGAVIGVLDDKDARVRQIACQWIAKSEIVEGFDSVLNLINDPKKDVRKAAIRTLGKITDEDKIPVLLDAAAGHEDKDVGSELASILTSEEFSQHFFGILREVEARCESAGMEAALVYVQITSKLRGVLGERILIGLLSHKDKLVRTGAVRAVSDLWLKEAVPILVKILTEDGKEPCEEAGRALARLGDSETQAALFDVTRSDDEFRRYAAIVALCGIGRESTIPRVVGMLDDKSARVVKQTHKTLLTVADIVYGTTPKVQPTRSSWESWLERANKEIEDIKSVNAKVKEIKGFLKERRGYKRAGVLVAECEETLGKIRRDRLVTSARLITNLSEGLRLMRYQCFKMQPLKIKKSNPAKSSLP